MSGFQFRLQLPLRLARANRAALRRELAQVMRQSLDANSNLQAMQQKEREIVSELAAGVDRGASGADLTMWTLQRELMRQALPQLQQICDDLVGQEQGVRQKLGQVSRETETYERLKREAYDAWRREKERHDQALVDDAVLVRRARAAALQTTEES